MFSLLQVAWLCNVRLRWTGNNLLREEGPSPAWMTLYFWPEVAGDALQEHSLSEILPEVGRSKDVPGSSNDFICCGTEPRFPALCLLSSHVLVASRSPAPCQPFWSNFSWFGAECSSSSQLYLLVNTQPVSKSYSKFKYSCHQGHSCWTGRIRKRCKPEWQANTLRLWHLRCL